MALQHCQLGRSDQFILDFPWTNFCLSGRGPSECAEHVMEVVLSGMEAYILHSFSLSKSTNSVRLVSSAEKWLY